MPDIKQIDIDRHLKAGKPSLVYFIFGDDTYAKQRAVDKLRIGLMPELMPDLNFNHFIGSRDSIRAIGEVVSQYPMLDSRRLVLMEDFDIEKLSASDMTELTAIISDLSGTSILVIWQNDVSAGVRSSNVEKLINLCRKFGSVFKADKPSPNEMARMLCDMAEQKDAKISMTEAVYMVRRCGNDLMLLGSELEKLSLFAGRKSITKDMIDLVCPPSLDADVYKISRNIIWGNIDEALRVTNGLFAQKTKPFEILAKLSQNFVDLYRAKCAVNSGKNGDVLLENFPNDYSKRKSFRADNAIRDQRGYSQTQLRRCVELLTDTHLSITGGRNDKRTCIEQLIVRLCYVKKEVR